MIVTIAASITACGGAIDYSGIPADSGVPISPGPASETPPDVADYRNVIPDGRYRVTVAAASCDVNQTYRDAGWFFVARSRAGQVPGVSLPLPWSTAGIAAGAPRQDVKLTTPSHELTVKDKVLCPGGSVRYAIHRKDLTATRMTFSFEREGLDCDVYAPLPLCTVDATFDLIERSCDPSCDPTRIEHVMTADGSHARCTCRS